MLFKKVTFLFLTFIILGSLLLLFKHPPSFANPDCPSSYDVNGDGTVNSLDMDAIAYNVGKGLGDPGFDPKYDLNHDGVINPADVQLVWDCLPRPSIAPVSLPSSPTGGNFTASGLVGQVVSAFLPIILGIAGFIAVIMIVISGIQFITSSGNPEAAAAARGRLTFAIIGFIIIILSYAILQIIDKLFLGTSGVV